MNTRTKNRAFRLSGPFYDLIKERAAVWETSLSDYLRGLVVLETIKNSSSERAFTLFPLTVPVGYSVCPSTVRSLTGCRLRRQMRASPDGNIQPFPGVRGRKRGEEGNPLKFGPTAAGTDKRQRSLEGLKCA